MAPPAPQPQAPRPRVTVVTVNYNAGAILTEAAKAALGSTAPVRMVVADNASRDGSLARLRAEFAGDPRLRVVESGRNLGFACGNNRALAWADGEYILLLNPDCVVGPQTIERVLAEMERHPEAGMAGCLIRNPDGSEQAGARRAVPTPWRAVVRTLGLHRWFPDDPRFDDFVLTRQPLPTRTVEVEAISGAFMFIRRRALDQVGLLDEGYFLHCEDLDLCMRFRESGWKILFLPHAEAVHVKGACGLDRPVRVAWHKHRGMVRFYNKFFRRKYSPLLFWAVVAGVWLRFCVDVGVVLLRPRRARG
ncbi:MAG: glycosyltransferase family 2 protein [Candidatus Lambdaproteobacteria bacterium]|nr:glycosyltransferase family 2 protein [Candidatus Lambdaproteobacteria bacterium]